MKSVLLLWSFLLVFDASSMSFDEYSENGICIHVVKNHVKTFTLLPTSTAVAIGERRIEDTAVRKLDQKNIVDANTGILLFGNKVEGGKREIRLEYENTNLLTFLFKLDQHNGRQLYLESVTEDFVPKGVSVGVFREIGGGGITYRIVIEKNKGAIEVLESIQKMPFPTGQQERLQKVDIKKTERP